MTRIRSAGIAAVLAALALAGCGEYPLKESRVEGTLPQATVPIVVGETDRTEVRRLLGAPWVSSEYWRFDLFRLSDENSVLFWYLLPMAVSSQEVSGYVLVTYDDRGAAAAYGYGFGREPSSFRMDPGEEAYLRAGDVEFIAAKKQAYLALTAVRRDSYLREHAKTNQCRVVFGCAPSHWCQVRVKVDGDRSVDVPEALEKLPFGLAILDLTAGEHRIEATPAWFSTSFAGAKNFSCPAGATRYVTLELSPDDTRGVSVWRRHLFANFAVSTEMPEALQALPLLIWGHGEWLVEAH